MEPEPAGLMGPPQPRLDPRYLHLNQNHSHTGLSVKHVTVRQPITPIAQGATNPGENETNISENAAILACLANTYILRALKLCVHRRLLGLVSGGLERFGKNEIVMWGRTLVDTNLSEFSIEIDRLLEAVGAEALSTGRTPAGRTARQVVGFFNSAKRLMSEERDLFIQQLIQRFSLGFQGPLNPESDWSVQEYLEQSVIVPADGKKHEEALLQWMEEVCKAYRDSWKTTFDSTTTELWKLTFYHGLSA